MSLVKAIVMYHMVNRTITENDFKPSSGAGAGGNQTQSGGGGNQTQSGGGGNQTQSGGGQGQSQNQTQPRGGQTQTQQQGGGQNQTQQAGGGGNQTQQGGGEQQQMGQLLPLSQLTSVPSDFANISLYLGKDSQGTLQVNDAQVVNQGNASNGVIYGINRVLTPLFLLNQSIYGLNVSSTATAGGNTSTGSGAFAWW
ncbi:hypothetical protein HDU76_005749 [Blyttiomyces sp. JEL0837]|nr:hypothetical protein HDU76_005749 [Blyttiomyces sp. JEL0837]